MRFLYLCAVLLGLLLAAGLSSAEEPTQKLLVIGQGPDGHPPKTHEFLAGTRVIAELLKNTQGIEVVTVDGTEPWPEGPELIDQADAVVIFVSQGGMWAQKDPRRYEALTRLAARGGGITALHWGIGAKDDQYIDGYQKLIGGIHGGKDRKYVVREVQLTPNEDHPITRGIDPFKSHDEYYYRLKMASEGKLTPILKADINGDQQTVAWAWERPQGGRSFGFAGLHFHENWHKKPYRRLVAQGILWTMNHEIPESGINVDIPAEVIRLR